MGFNFKIISFLSNTCVNARTDLLNSFSCEGAQESALPLPNHFLKHPHIHCVHT